MSDTFRNLEKNPLVQCVLDVLDQNVAREGNQGAYKGHADIWCINDNLRREITDRACEFWTQHTGLDCTEFPLSVDAVARIYLRLRKRNKDEVEKMTKDF